MNNPIVKILRFLVFFPICFIVFALINLGLVYLFYWIFSLGTFWFFVVVIILGGFIWKLFLWLALLLTLLASYISPIKWLSTLTIALLALANGVYLIIKIWTGDFEYSGWDIFAGIILTIIALELTFSIISGVVGKHEEDRSDTLI